MQKISIKKWLEKFELNDKRVQQNLLFNLEDNFYVQSEKHENSVHLKGKDDEKVYCRLHIEEGNLFFINHITGHTKNKVEDKFINYIYDAIATNENKKKFFNNSYGKIIVSENIDLITKNILMEYENDLSYQERVMKAKPINITRESQKTKKVINVWLRNPRIAKNEVEKAKYECSIDKNHKTFIAKTTTNNYVEVHHLIPMNQQDNFKENNLDVQENIVVLCPNCHKKLHYAIFADKKDIIKQLYDMKKKDLKACGIEISLDKLLDMYK